MEARVPTDIPAVEQILGHHFATPELLLEALSHSSWANEHQLRSNERLEFIGDSVLNAAVTTLIAQRFPQAREGALSRLRAQLVDERTLAEIALRQGLAEHLRLGRGEESSGGRQKMRVLADLAEAVLGALYLDADFEAVLVLVERWLEGRMDALEPEGDPREAWKNARAALQEHTQKHLSGQLPVYEVAGREGPDHQPVFTVDVSVSGEVVGTGRAGTKHEARRRAAEDALARLGVEES